MFPPPPPPLLFACCCFIRCTRVCSEFTSALHILQMSQTLWSGLAEQSAAKPRSRRSATMMRRRVLLLIFFAASGSSSSIARISPAMPEYRSVVVSRFPDDGFARVKSFTAFTIFAYRASGVLL